MKEKLDIEPHLKMDIFDRIEIEVWDEFSGRLKLFFVRMSLIEHLSPELLGILIGDDQDLREEFCQHCIYVSFNKYINAYLIQHLFLDFLKTKQGMLSEDIKRETYKAAACWSEKNGFLADALSYYEKTGDYKAKRAVEEKIKGRIISFELG